MKKISEVRMTKSQILDDDNYKMSNDSLFILENPGLMPKLSYLDYMLSNITVKTHFGIDFTLENGK